MRLKVKDLAFVNIGQIVDFSPHQDEDDSPLHVLGTLDAVENYSDGYSLVVGGNDYSMDGDDQIDMYRSVELHTVRQVAEDVKVVADNAFN